MLCNFFDRCWQNFQFRWAMAHAYIAANIGETDVSDNYKSWADEAQRKLDTLRIQ